MISINNLYTSQSRKHAYTLKTFTNLSLSSTCFVLAFLRITAFQCHFTFGFLPFQKEGFYDTQLVKGKIFGVKVAMYQLQYNFSCICG